MQMPNDESIRLVLVNDGCRGVARKILGALNGEAAVLPDLPSWEIVVRGRILRGEAYGTAEHANALADTIHAARLLTLAPEALEGLEGDDLALAVTAILETDRMIGDPAVRREEEVLVEEFVRHFPAILRFVFRTPGKPPVTTVTAFIPRMDGDGVSSLLFADIPPEGESMVLRAQVLLSADSMVFVSALTLSPV